MKLYRTNVIEKVIIPKVLTKMYENGRNMELYVGSLPTTISKVAKIRKRVASLHRGLLYGFVFKKLKSTTPRRVVGVVFFPTKVVLRVQA